MDCDPSKHFLTERSCFEGGFKKEDDGLGSAGGDDVVERSPAFALFAGDDDVAEEERRDAPNKTTITRAFGGGKSGAFVFQVQDNDKQKAVLKVFMNAYLPGDEVVLGNERPHREIQTLCKLSGKPGFPTLYSAGRMKLKDFKDGVPENIRFDPPSDGVKYVAWMISSQATGQELEDFDLVENEAYLLGGLLQIISCYTTAATEIQGFGHFDFHPGNIFIDVDNTARNDLPLNNVMQAIERVVYGGVTQLMDWLEAHTPGSLPGDMVNLEQKVQAYVKRLQAFISDESYTMRAKIGKVDKSVLVTSSKQKVAVAFESSAFDVYAQFGAPLTEQIRKAADFIQQNALRSTTINPVGAMVSKKVRTFCDRLKREVVELTYTYMATNVDVISYPVVTIIDFDLATGVGGYEVSLPEHENKLKSAVPVTERCVAFVKKYIPEALVVKALFECLQLITRPLPDVQRGDVAHLLTYCFVFLTVSRRPNVANMVKALRLSSRRLLEHFRNLSNRNPAESITPLGIIFDAMNEMDFSISSMLASVIPSKSTLYNLASNTRAMAKVRELNEKTQQYKKYIRDVVDLSTKKVLNPMAEQDYNDKLWNLAYVYDRACTSSDCSGRVKRPLRAAWNQDNTGLLVNMLGFARNIRVTIPPRNVMAYMAPLSSQSSPEDYTNVFAKGESIVYDSFGASFSISGAAIKASVRGGTPTLAVRNADDVSAFCRFTAGFGGSMKQAFANQINNTEYPDPLTWFAEENPTKSVTSQEDLTSVATVQIYSVDYKENELRVTFDLTLGNGIFTLIKLLDICGVGYVGKLYGVASYIASDENLLTFSTNIVQWLVSVVKAMVLDYIKISEKVQIKYEVDSSSLIRGTLIVLMDPDEPPMACMRAIDNPADLQVALDCLSDNIVKDLILPMLAGQAPEPPVYNTPCAHEQGEDGLCYDVGMEGNTRYNELMEYAKQACHASITCNKDDNDEFLRVACNELLKASMLSGLLPSKEDISDMQIRLSFQQITCDSWMIQKNCVPVNEAQATTIFQLVQRDGALQYMPESITPTEFYKALVEVFYKRIVAEMSQYDDAKGTLEALKESPQDITDQIGDGGLDKFKDIVVGIVYWLAVDEDLQFLIARDIEPDDREGMLEAYTGTITEAAKSSAREQSAQMWDQLKGDIEELEQSLEKGLKGMFKEDFLLCREFYQKWKTVVGDIGAMIRRPDVAYEAMLMMAFGELNTEYTALFRATSIDSLHAMVASYVLPKRA